MSKDQAVVSACEFSQPSTFFRCSGRDSWFAHVSVFINNTFVRFAFTVSASARGQEMMSVLPDQPISSMSFTFGLRFCLLPAIFLCHPHFQVGIDLAFDAQIGIPSPVRFPIHVLTELFFSNCLSHDNPASG